MLLETFRERGRWRDWIPGTEGGAAEHRAERRGFVAFDENAIADFVSLLHFEANRREVLFSELTAELERFEVRLDQLVFPLELFGQQLLHQFRFEAEQVREHADIADVLEQLALARIGKLGRDQLSQRRADNGDVVAKLRGGQRLR